MKEWLLGVAGLLCLMVLVASLDSQRTEQEQREEVEQFAQNNIPVGAKLLEITRYGLQGSGLSRRSYPTGTEYIYDFRGRCYLVTAEGGHKGLKTQEVNCK